MKTGATLAFFGILFLLVGLTRPQPETPPPHAISGGSQGGLPWESLTAPGDEIRALYLIMNDSPRERLAQLASFSATASSPLALGLSEFATGWTLVKEGRSEEAVERFLSPSVTHTRLGAYALDQAARALEARAPERALGLLARLVTEHGDYIHSGAARVRLARGALSLRRAGEAISALAPLAADAGGAERGEALLLRAEAFLALGQKAEARRELETLHYQLPESPHSGEAGRRLLLLPAVQQAARSDRYQTALGRAERLYQAGQFKAALREYEALEKNYPKEADRDWLLLRQGACQYELRSVSAAERTLGRIQSKDPSMRAEALYHQALAARRRRAISLYAERLVLVLDTAPSSRWAEEALAGLARHHRFEKNEDLALRYYRRLAEDFPAGKYFAEARWAVLWTLYRKAQFEEAAPALARTAWEHPSSTEHSRFLFWAARAYEKLGEVGEARTLYRQVLLGYKNTYYGRQAEEHLALIDGPGAAVAALSEARQGIDLRQAIEVGDRERLERVGQLFGLGLFEEAALEAERGASDPEDGAAFRAVYAWIQFQRGRLGLAIRAMRDAFPFHASATGDLLPGDVWQILYPLRYWEFLEAYSRQRDLDPYLVAALIRQESTFNPSVRSRAGARGLMQILPSTGRGLARREGTSYGRQGLYDPEMNIRLGTRYLKQMLEEFGGRIDFALAGYNAGPHRVRQWTGGDLTLDPEEFIEEIPFTETRDYVKLVLRNEAQYRRIYAEAPVAAQ
jgi:soluble lytic murein transglycosylase